jgi:hypothetical protein
MKRVLKVILLALAIVITTSGCSYFWPDDGGNTVLLVPEVVSPRTSYFSEPAKRDTVIKTAKLTFQNSRGRNLYTASVTIDGMGIFRQNAEGIFTIYVMIRDNPNYGTYLEYPARVIRTPSTQNMVFAITLLGEIDESILVDGTSGVLTVITEQRDDVIAVPQSAVRQYFNHWIIGVLENGTREDRIVEVGLIGDEKIEITGGLSEGEYIVFK